MDIGRASLWIVRKESKVWLSLTEYSMKHKVSISTLRRKIKSTEIPYRLEDGKYVILDDSDDQNNASNEKHRPSLKSDSYSNGYSTPNMNNVKESGESVITAANRLLSDLKKAYTQVLQDKEEQISCLKEEISDLKTLIKVLESENDRLRRGN